MELFFTEWLPDLPAYKNPGLTVAKNVLPGSMGYEPFPSASVYSSALDDRCQGAISTKDTAGNSKNFAGDASKLYMMTSAAYADVSKVGGYTTNEEENWNWTRFADLLLATNFADPIQTFTLTSSSNFADLSAGAPLARYITTTRNFVVVGNTFDASDGLVPHRVRWCALNDATDWTVSAVTMADYNDLDPSKGWVKQVVGGDFGAIIFQERAISRMSFKGSPEIFEFSEVESSRGTLMPGSVVKVGGMIYYAGLDGFYAFDGQQSIPIGTNKVDKTFFDDLDTAYYHRVGAVPDVTKQIIYWNYPGAGNSGGNCNKRLCYNYVTKKWSDIEEECLVVTLSEGYTMDGLDAVNTNLDLITTSLDSRSWTGENYILSAFNSDHKQVNYTGVAMDATLETGEFQITERGRTFVSLTRPIVDGSGTVTQQLGTRELHSDSVTWSTESSVNDQGNCEFRSDARYHRLRTSITGGFNTAQGVELLEFAAAGSR
jgi:hypothetical protein